MNEKYDWKTGQDPTLLAHGIVMNPGTGPVSGGAEQARANIDALMTDVGVSGFDVTPQGQREDGRFSFEVAFNGQRREVDMPGLPLEQVRYLGEADQNILDFPRLYVDGSSWVWRYALGILTREP